MLHGNVKLPIWSLMSKFVLNMPIHSAIRCIQFDETIVTESLITLAFTDLVAIFKKILVSELKREEKLRY